MRFVSGLITISFLLSGATCAPAIADTTNACPRQLEVFGIDAMVNNNEGLYTMTGEKRNGWPIWINANEDRWIYVSSTNHWHLSKTYEDDNTELFAEASFDHNCPMDLTYKVWTDKWIEKASFNIIAVCPRQLEVTGSDAAVNNIEGVISMTGEKRNGWPIWVNANEDLWIYVSSTNHWRLSKTYEDDNNELFAEASFGQNCPMDLTYKVWTDKWIEKASFNVIAACPRQLEVTGSDVGVNNNEGVYTMTGEKRSGYPVWMNRNKDRWIYLSSTNYWQLSKSYEDENDKLFLEAPFDHNCPMDLTYKVWTDKWIENASYNVIAACPRLLEVTGSDAELNNNKGVYTMTGERRRGYPVWINANKDRWLFVSINNYWHLSKFYNEDNKKSFAYASFDHNCPNDLAYLVWDDKWMQKPSFDVIVACPQQLEVSGSDAELNNNEGVYTMTGEKRNGWPIWINANKDRWIFVSSTNHWQLSKTYEDDNTELFAEASFDNNCPMDLTYKVWTDKWTEEASFNVIAE